MALTKNTRAELERELTQLKNERAQLDEAIAAFEAVLAAQAAAPGAGAPAVSDEATAAAVKESVAATVKPSNGSRPRRRLKSTHAVAKLLKKAGRPLSPREIAALAVEAGKRMEYDAIYSALRKSPLFTKSG